MSPADLVEPDNEAKSAPACGWSGVPGIALLLAPYGSVKARASLAPSTARHAAPPFRKLISESTLDPETKLQINIKPQASKCASSLPGKLLRDSYPLQF